MSRSESKDPPRPGGSAERAGLAPPRPLRTPEPVGFDSRLAAAILDVVFLLTVAVLLSPLLDKLKRPAYTGGPGLDPADVDGAFGLLLYLLYSTTEVLTAATLGKRLLDVRVACRDGTRSSVRRRAARWAVKGSPLLLTALPAAVGLLSRSLPALGVKVPGAAGRAAGHLAQTADGLIVAFHAAAAVAAVAIAVGGLWIFLPGARTLHDRVAGTAVLSDSDVSAATSPGHGFFPLLHAVPLGGRQAGRQAAPVPSLVNAPGGLAAARPFPPLDKDVRS